ncbi:MAG: NAD-dependent epimerase/dehydratase family protein [Treponema sp.]|nr:NAD-dependent epimerase/dehydratase family protein [Treponema sp.]
MKKMLVTGGTVFVSKYLAEYFAKKDFEVFVLNRNTRPQPENTMLIQADRDNIGTALRGKSFDIVIDTGYAEKDVRNLLTAFDSPELCGSQKYIFISSSAVYPETLPQPFKESAKTGRNKIWGDYGTNKIQAEEYLLLQKKDSYIIRPPYLYGPMNNVYREAFVFECAQKARTFYMPKDGSLKLQFFYIEDLCKVIETIIERNVQNHIINVGNEECTSALDWVKTCYEVAGTPLSIKNVDGNIGQRNYFPFYDYEYKLDVTIQKELLPKTQGLMEGLAKSYEWYKKNQDAVSKKNFIAYIDKEIAK